MFLNHLKLFYILLWWLLYTNHLILLFLRFDQASSLLNSMIDVRAWAEYVVEWAAKDPYGFLTTVILALTPLFIASALLSWKLAKMIEAREREQKKKQKRQENIAKAKRTKKDWGNKKGMRAYKTVGRPPCSQPSLFLPCLSPMVSTGPPCLISGVGGNTGDPQA